MKKNTLHIIENVSSEFATSCRKSLKKEFAEFQKLWGRIVDDDVSDCKIVFECLKNIYAVTLKKG